MAGVFYSQPVMPHAFLDLHHHSAASTLPFASVPRGLSNSAGAGLPSASRVSPARMKRKYSESSEDDVEAAASRSPTPPSHHQPHKRRRLGAIERSLQDMSLQQLPPHPAPEQLPIVEEPDDDAITPGYSYYGDIEDLTPSPTREVRMHNASWYEPEKDSTFCTQSSASADAHMTRPGIIITDLDASDDEGEDLGADTTHTPEELQISPAVLDALRRSRAALRVPVLTSHYDASALVLYRPSPWRHTPQSLTALDEPQIEVLEDVDFSMPSDGAEPMDVDMMDVDEF